MFSLLLTGYVKQVKGKKDAMRGLLVLLLTRFPFAGAIVQEDNCNTRHSSIE
jgi:hypothetical protein